MFEHVVNSVYIPSDDVICDRLDVFGGLLFYDNASGACRQRGFNFLALEGFMVWHGC